MRAFASPRQEIRKSWSLNRRITTSNVPCSLGRQGVQERPFVKLDRFPAALGTRSTTSLGHDFSRIPVRSADQSIVDEPLQELGGVGGGGVDLRATALDVKPTVDFPDGFRWMQTVITNDPLENMGPESVDGAARAGREPFYYRYNPEEKEPRSFADLSHRKLPGEGHTTQWDATLTLVGVNKHPPEPLTREGAKEPELTVWARAREGKRPDPQLQRKPNIWSRAAGETGRETRRIAAFDIRKYGFRLSRVPGTDVDRVEMKTLCGTGVRSPNIGRSS